VLVLGLVEQRQGQPILAATAGVEVLGFGEQPGSRRHRVLGEPGELEQGRSTDRVESGGAGRRVRARDLCCAVLCRQESHPRRSAVGMAEPHRIGMRRPWAGGVRFAWAGSVITAPSRKSLK
jgi:hypothetical protein